MKLIECPRDAMQGIEKFIPTVQKIEYINRLLRVGFDAIDFGSFVSPKAIPQLSDTAEVLNGLDLRGTKTKLLSIIANERGANDACHFESIDYLGFPFSISEEFQKRNTNSSIDESFERVKSIQEISVRNNKQLVIYISMAFGNPYGEEWNSEIVAKWIDELKSLEIKTFSLADTIGVSTSDNINELFTDLSKQFTDIELGVHLHSTRETEIEKINAAYKSGCKRIDSAIRGFGGCPMAEDDLVGNVSTESVLEVLDDGDKSNIDINLFNEARKYSFNLF